MPQNIKCKLEDKQNYSILTAHIHCCPASSTKDTHTHTEKQKKTEKQSDV
jgi:hypothetical protein